MLLVFLWIHDDRRRGDRAGPPCALDHGAIAPVVCVFVRRPRGDGVNVYVSLPKRLLGTFSECVFVNETASVLVEE